MLQLVGLIHDLAATPDPDIIEVGDHGLRSTTWDELLLVDHWRRFMTNPNAYLRHVIRP
ncbi:hypothetical protein GCM10023205_25510 [Yinghuangia aomiensis]|uniref:Uncharacterized protein n=1 Tax=Yinghuangia aomiensis TaxID=676205 RepID=A0ABP9H4A4_9ACTN